MSILRLHVRLFFVVFQVFLNGSIFLINTSRKTTIFISPTELRLLYSISYSIQENISIHPIEIFTSYFLKSHRIHPLTRPLV